MPRRRSQRREQSGDEHVHGVVDGETEAERRQARCRVGREAAPGEGVDQQVLDRAEDAGVEGDAAIEPDAAARDGDEGEQRRRAGHGVRAADQPDVHQAAHRRDAHLQRHVEQTEARRGAGAEQDARHDEAVVGGSGEAQAAEDQAQPRLHGEADRHRHGEGDGGHGQHEARPLEFGAHAQAPDFLLEEGAPAGVGRTLVALWTGGYGSRCLGRSQDGPSRRRAQERRSVAVAA